MATFAAYQYATRCTSTAYDNGTEALLAFLVKRYRGRNYGVYNCRSVRGPSSTRSIHSEARALDVGFATVSGKANPRGTALVNELIKIGPWRLGIQQIIWNRRIWSRKHPNGARYRGTVPHVDHVHIELTRQAGANLNLTTISRLFGGTAPRPAAATKTARPVLYLGNPKGNPKADVEYLQRRLRAHGIRVKGVLVGVDGNLGPQTHSGVGLFQDKYGLYKDYVVGPNTWRKLG